MRAFADFLVLFDAPIPVLARDRTRPWRTVAANQNWRALAQEPDGEGAPRIFQEWTDGSARAWLLGELTSYRALSSASDGTPFQRICRDLRMGAEAPETLNGHFALIVHDGATRRWHVWTNRLGTLHVYHARHGDRAAIGTFAPAVAAAASARQLDWMALTGFFAFGFFPEDRTHFEDVRILRGGMRYTFDEKGTLTEVAPYWRWRYEPQARSFDDSVDAFAELFDRVMDDQSSAARVAVPISGGLDSRSTVVTLTRRGRPKPNLWFYSYGWGHRSREVRIARAIAESRQLPLATYEIGEYLFNRLDDAIAVSEGFADVTQIRQLAVTPDLAAHSSHVVAAHWGDVWLDDVGFEGPAREEPLLRAALDKMLKGGRRWLLDELCAPHLDGLSPEPILSGYMLRELERLDYIEDAAFRLKALKTEQWSFRWTTAGIRAYQPASFPRLPFYDNRLVDFFCTVATEHVGRRALQIEYIRRSAPDLARIRWQEYDANLYWYRFHDTLLLPERALKKGLRVLTRRQPIQRNWEVQFLSRAGRSHLEVALLTPGLRLHSLLARERVRDLLQCFYAQPQAEKRGYTLSMLLTFAHWLECYA